MVRVRGEAAVRCRTYGRLSSSPTARPWRAAGRPAGCRVSSPGGVGGKVIQAGAPDMLVFGPAGDA